MARLDQERQKELEPKRLLYAKNQIESKGYEVTIAADSRIEFVFKGNTIKFFPYSGWASGIGIQDGRGIKNLLNQI